jgi:hypothetical protein
MTKNKMNIDFPKEKIAEFRQKGNLSEFVLFGRLIKISRMIFSRFIYAEVPRW